MHIISLKIVSVKSDQSYGLFNVINSIFLFKCTSCVLQRVIWQLTNIYKEYG